MELKPLNEIVKTHFKNDPGAQQYIRGQEHMIKKIQDYTNKVMNEIKSNKGVISSKKLATLAFNTFMENGPSQRISQILTDYAVQDVKPLRVGTGYQVDYKV